MSGFRCGRIANQLVKVPTVAMRNGDFSGLINNAGILQQLYDPKTTQTAANNYSRAAVSATSFPMNRISPLAKTLYAATPLPQTADNPLVNSNFNATNNTPQTVPNLTVRLDHVFNENNRVLFPLHGHRAETAGAAQLSVGFAGEHRGRRIAGGRDRLPGDSGADHQRQRWAIRRPSLRRSSPRRF